MSRKLNLYSHKLTNIINNSNDKKDPHAQQPVAKSVDFVEVPIKNLITAHSCLIKHPNGSTMSLEISTQQLPAIIKGFICSN